jgi:hypothetical protein
MKVEEAAEAEEEEVRQAKYIQLSMIPVARKKKQQNNQVAMAQEILLNFIQIGSTVVFPQRQ